MDSSYPARQIALTRRPLHSADILDVPAAMAGRPISPQIIATSTDTPKSTSKTTNPISPPTGLTGCATPHCGQIGVLRFSLLPQFRQWVLSDILT
ncbi:hypothetical protein [Roseovarius pacificus]|uniref:hypothetical protein n=1 Tax=Roseovarius pacificus TaxID=337701 RepID=UPI00093480E7|nr:hypothetical protein [Roseovarius pacificus]GGO62276.1 hypothetical protein GCM10011315_40900 [Roseovarius pacificus]